MDSSSKKQLGSTLVIAVIVLAVVIVGLLGFIFWQNFIKSDTEKQANSQTSTETLPTDVAKAEELTGSYSLPVENLYFNYPSDWKFITKYKNNNGNVDNRILLVSDNNFGLEINISSYGPNWPFGERPLLCPFDDGYNTNSAQGQDVCPEYTTLLAEPSSNLPGNSVFIFKTTYPNSDILEDNINLTFAKDGCKGLESAFCERPSVKTGNYLYVNGNYYEEISEANKEEAGMYSDVIIKKMDDNNFVKSQDVQTAIAILKSIKYKN